MGGWQYRDGAWRDARDPTDAEIVVIDGSAKTVDFGEHANKAHEEVQTKEPQYVAYLVTEDQRGRYEAKKFTHRANR